MDGWQQPAAICLGHPAVDQHRQEHGAWAFRWCVGCGSSKVGDAHGCEWAGGCLVITRMYSMPQAAPLLRETSQGLQRVFEPLLPPLPLLPLVLPLLLQLLLPCPARGGLLGGWGVQRPEPLMEDSGGLPGGCCGKWGACMHVIRCVSWIISGGRSHCECPPESKVNRLLGVWGWLCFQMPGVRIAFPGVHFMEATPAARRA